MNYREAVSYIEEIPKFTTKSSPEATRSLMKRLGDPQERFRTVHVAGTNGKGSVCAMLSGALIDAGIRTGVFTSPHLVDVRERIVVDHEVCDEEAFLRAFCRVREAADAMRPEGYAHPAYFEFLYAIGMLIFEERRIDYAVIETGLGGRLDATNIVEKPVLTVITSIGPDHMKYLGHTVQEIAGEKAGIIKHGCPVVYDASDIRVRQVIEKRAGELNAPCFAICENTVNSVEIHGNSVDFSCESLYDGSVSIRLPFPAFYQAINGAIAFRAAELLPPLKAAGKEAVIKSFAKTVHPGRMQELSPGVFLDGAHNEPGIRELVRTVRAIGGKRPVLLFAQMADKDLAASAALLAEIPWERIVVTSIPESRVHTPEEIRDAFLTRGVPAERILTEPDPMTAYRLAKGLRSEGEILFCAGSLYLMGLLISKGEPT